MWRAWDICCCTLEHKKQVHLREKVKLVSTWHLHPERGRSSERTTNKKWCMSSWSIVDIILHRACGARQICFPSQKNENVTAPDTLIHTLCVQNWGVRARDSIFPSGRHAPTSTGLRPVIVNQTSTCVSRDQYLFPSVIPYTYQYTLPKSRLSSVEYNQRHIAETKVNRKAFLAYHVPLVPSKPRHRGTVVPQVPLSIHAETRACEQSFLAYHSPKGFPFVRKTCAAAPSLPLPLSLSPYGRRKHVRTARCAKTRTIHSRRQASNTLVVLPESFIRDEVETNGSAIQL